MRVPRCGREWYDWLMQNDSEHRSEKYINSLVYKYIDINRTSLDSAYGKIVFDNINMQYPDICKAYPNVGLNELRTAAGNICRDVNIVLFANTNDLLHEDALVENVFPTELTSVGINLWREELYTLDAVYRRFISRGTLTDIKGIGHRKEKTIIFVLSCVPEFEDVIQDNAGAFVSAAHKRSEEHIDIAYANLVSSFSKLKVEYNLTDNEIRKAIVRYSKQLV